MVKTESAIRKQMAEELLHILNAGGDAYSRLANIRIILEAECHKAMESSIVK
jgi:hypothetical protein